MLKIYSYTLPFVTPFVTSNTSYKEREGLILVFEHNGITAFGEVAPLPGFSSFSIKDILPILKINAEVINSALKDDEFQQLYSVLNQIHSIPSLKFGMDTLYHDLQAKKAGISLAKYLFKDSFQNSIDVNATLGIESSKITLQKADKLSRQGFRTLKIKVGSDFEKEFTVLSLLRKEFPDLKIRIDANQSWTYETAYLNLKTLEHLKLEYCEEPLLSTERNRLPELKQSVKLNLAADESFRNKTDALTLSEQNAVHTFILKPMMFGSFSEINVTKQLANSHYISVVLTTSLESIIGRTVTAILALGWGSQNFAHGLSTGSLLKSDIGSGNYIKNGVFTDPKKPGIGIDLNFNCLKRII